MMPTVNAETPSIPASTSTLDATLPGPSTLSCILCFAKKIKCDRQSPCSTCVKHNVDCVIRTPRRVEKRHFTSPGLTTQPIYSCLRCHAKKVKCDREKPCSACRRLNFECVYNPSPTAPRPIIHRKKRPRVIEDPALTNRLKHYETILHVRGNNPNGAMEGTNSELRPVLNPGITDLNGNSVQTTNAAVHDAIDVTRSQVVHNQDRSKFVENALWTRIVEELPTPEDALEDSSDEAGEAGEEETPDDHDFGFVLVNISKTHNMLVHPSVEQIPQLWEIFVENVDPLTKLIHVPTLQPVIQKATVNLKVIPRSLEALMFAIYSAAIMSLKDEQCRSDFGETRQDLLVRYISLTRTALLQAKFMETTSLLVLQALVLHLIVIRDISEPRAVWSLTGIAVRIGQCMGLERDGEALGLPPFETEIRRRVWWLLKTHDFQTAELCGLLKFRDLDTSSESTKWPSNVDDHQLYPNMCTIQPVAGSNAMTDAVFIALRGELIKFTSTLITKIRSQGKPASQWNLITPGPIKEDIKENSRQLEELLETKYLRYCDPSQPLHLMAMLMVRSSLNIICFQVNHPRRWVSIDQTPASERQMVWDVCIKLLEQHNMFYSNSQLRQFSWHAPWFLQWHVIIHVLDTLRADPIVNHADKTWRLLASIYEHNSDIILDTKKPFYVAIGNLCLKAHSAREDTFHQKKLPFPPTLKFILRLRQQREEARIKLREREAKRLRREHPAAGTNHQDDLQPSSNGFSSSPETTNLPVDSPGDASFWFEGLYDGQQANAMDIDVDVLLAYYDASENDSPGAISWEQWDEWLAKSN